MTKGVIFEKISFIIKEQLHEPELNISRQLSSQVQQIVHLIKSVMLTLFEQAQTVF